MKKAKLIQKDKKEEQKKVETISLKKSIIVVFTMLIVLTGFYFLTEKLLEKQTKEAEVQTINIRETNDINYSDIDDIVSDSYYMLLSKKEDKNNANYDEYINLLAQYNFEYSFYYIDLSKEANEKLFNSDKEKLKDLDDIQVKDTTLIFVKEGEIEATYVGSDKILEHLSSFFEIESEQDESEEKEENKLEAKETSNKKEK